MGVAESIPRGALDPQEADNYRATRDTVGPEQTRARVGANENLASVSTDLAPKAHVSKPMSHGLWPREHGAYGQLALPLIAALFSPRPTIPAALYAIGAVAGFLAHEPALILLGQRGPRARMGLGQAAKQRVILLALIATVATVSAIALAPTTLAAVIIVAALAAALTWMIRAKSEKTLLGETLAAAALSGSGFITALAAGAGWSFAWLTWIAWVLGFACATAGVRTVIGQFKGRREKNARLVLALGSVLVVALAWLEAYLVLVCLPIVLVAWAVALISPHPRHLKKVGWMLVASTVVTAGLIIAAAQRGTLAPQEAVANTLESPIAAKGPMRIRLVRDLQRAPAPPVYSGVVLFPQRGPSFTLCLQSLVLKGGQIGSNHRAPFFVGSQNGAMQLLMTPKERL